MKNHQASITINNSKKTSFYTPFFLTLLIYRTYLVVDTNYKNRQGRVTYCGPNFLLINWMNTTANNKKFGWIV